MIKEHIITTNKKQRGTSQEQIEICTKRCPYPKKKCNGECDFFMKEAKRIQETRQLKKNIVVF